MTHYEPPGLKFHDGHSGRWMIYCYPDCPRESLRGWICYQHFDGQWVTLRKATDADIAAINAAVVRDHHDSGPKMDPSTANAKAHSTETP